MTSSSSSCTVHRSMFRVEDSSNNVIMVISDQGIIGIGYTTSASGTLNVNGRVGISTNDPQAKLHVVHSGINDPCFRVDDAVSDTSPFIIDPDGKVGIGTTTPSCPLHVKIDSSAANTPLVTITEKYDAVNRNALSLDTLSGNDRDIGIALNNQGTTKWSIYNDGGAGADHDLVFLSGSSNTVMVLEQGGNVGIGTTSPTHKLRISDSDTTAGRAGLMVTQSGAISGTGYGLYVSKTGASTTNIGGYFSASGGVTNNYGLIVENGDVGIGTTSPDYRLTIGDGSTERIHISGSNTANSPTSGVVIYFNGTDLIVKNSGGYTVNLTNGFS